MKLVGASLLGFLLSVDAASTLDPKFVQKKNRALRILSSRRQARDNNDLFEEIQKGNLERECVEEKCDYEELKEVYEDEGEADKWWKKTVRKCTNDPPEQRCDPKNTLKCINQWNAKTCQCKKGWSGDLCKEDVDECANPEIAVSCGEKACINTEGSFKCGCESGYQQVGEECEDINECSVDNGGCEHVCNNEKGGFQCACNTGFKLSVDGKSCEDIDECSENPDSCGPNSQCVNNVGSFECNCNDGYSHGLGDTTSSTCEDVNECETGDSECPDNSVCENLVGSYTCNCPPGLSYDSDAKECVDIDECEQNACGDHLCRNIHGSYSCSCYDGYAQISQDSRSDNSAAFTCEDVDECATGTHTCNSPEEECVNTDGSFTCNCAPGFESVGEKCQDIDECLNNPCPDSCFNIPGDFVCGASFSTCEHGYEYVIPEGAAPEDGVCEDINECEFENGGCSHECVNSDGSYECKCNVGFIDINGECKDIDECSAGDVCQDDGTLSCVNTLGSYECTCQTGYKTNAEKTSCTDIDECKELDVKCDFEGEVCHNFPGGFECIAEVKTGCAVENKCDHQCNDNEDGSISCSCWPGYELSCDGHTCLKDYDVELESKDMLNQEDCPAGFVKLGGKYSDGCSACFFASFDKADRDHAAKVCEGLGASLAVVQNKEQNFYLSELFSAEEQFWIGAKFNEDEDDFLWDDGSAIKFSRWAKNEPSTAISDEPSAEPEYCVVGNWGYPGHWNDLPCAYNEARYACSKMHSCDGAAPQKVVEKEEVQEEEVNEDYDDQDEYEDEDEEYVYEDDEEYPEDYEEDDDEEDFYTS